MMDMFGAQVKAISDSAAEAAMNRAVDQVRRNLPLYTQRCQNHSSVGGVYPACENTQWTCGFWPGEIWLAWEWTKEECFRKAGLTLVKDFDRRIREKVSVDHHDMGFLYTPSCVAAYKLTGNTQAKEAALLAADQLMTRFQRRGRFFQAWGAMEEEGNNRYIIDCLLNLPLLYWASEVTGEQKYAEAAKAHTETCFRYSFREDGSTYHTFYFHPDGTPDRGETCQGYRRDSAWARGQAWGIYGSALSYRYTRNAACLEMFRHALSFYLSRLPDDLIPYWDLIFSDGSGEPRDTSSAAITVCGLLEAEPFLSSLEGRGCRILARQMLTSLAEHNTPAELTPGGGLLLHGTYSKKSPYNTCTEEGVDECTSWGDYFYMEALTRLTKKWSPYW